jgi:signal transduction histidine kinase
LIFNDEWRNILILSFDKVLNSFDGILFWTEDTKKSSVQYSENILALTGYCGSDIQQKKNGWLDIIYEEDLINYQERLAEFEKDRGRDSISLNYRITKKNGEVILVSERIKVNRKADGKIKTKFGFVQDVSNLRQEIEDLKQKNEELEQLNSSKDNFISFLSHDLRAPFTSILGFSEILLNENKLPEKDKEEYIKYIFDSSQNQLQLINHLFDWSHLQTGRLKLEIQRLHAQSIAYSCVSNLTEMAIRKNITIDVKVPETFYIDADERFFSKALINLVSNAVKYSPENELVRVTANIYTNNFIEFVVKDKGIGISETNLEKIFNLGKLFTTEGTRGEKGTGLGLLLSKKIIEKHGGEIWFFSSEGKGSEFHFTIPAAASSILLVFEDGVKSIHIEKNILKTFPELKIIKAENAFEALELISAKMPSLIVIEHNLPLMDGLQFISTLRENNKFFQIPLIAFIGSDDAPVLNSYLDLGVKVIRQEAAFSESLKEKIKSLLFV